jgi:uncharacterized protein with FMN-binding domain
MNKKHFIIQFIILALITIITIICTKILFTFKNFDKKINSIVIENINFNNLTDGEYQNRVDFELINAKVKITIANKKIVTIDILEHKHGPAVKYGAEKITERIIANQSLQVDTISGATYSSKVILKAVEGALKQGL